MTLNKKLARAALFLGAVPFTDTSSYLTAEPAPEPSTIAVAANRLIA